jgi:acyl-CoA synthetase (AMP-forming)/AMP-acid ligase II
VYFTQSLHRAVQQHPDKIAVRFAGRERTFREFADRVGRLAGALKELGMNEGDRVAMLSLNSDRYLEYLMAVPWGGGVVNPCNTRWSIPELRHALDDSGSTILLVDDTFSEAGAQLLREAQTLRALVHCGDGQAPGGMFGYESLLADARPIPDAVRCDEDLLGIFYTGGTTGFPKGVMRSHLACGISGLAAQAAGLGEPGGTYLHAAPMFHIADFGLAMPHWIAGNTHSIVPGFQPDAVLAAIARDRVTNTVLVPTMIRMLVDHIATGAAGSTNDLGSLRTVAYGAAPISEALLEQALAVLPGTGFVQLFGMTEIGPLTINPPDCRPGASLSRRKLHSAGRASGCVELKIADPLGNEVPRGTVGEILARSSSLMQGYWNKPDATAEAVRDGWYHTGDGGWMDDEGYLHIVDRMKDMIVSGGENVYSAEVENAIASHPAVASCAVIGIPSEQWGEAVHAAVVLHPGLELDAQALIAHCRMLIAATNARVPWRSCLRCRCQAPARC